MAKAWYGIKKWNGTETEDARMEWKGRIQKWHGRLSYIRPYQFHTRFRPWYLQKNTVYTDSDK